MKKKGVLLVCLFVFSVIGTARADVLKLFAGNGTGFPQIGDNAVNIYLLPYSVRHGLTRHVFIPSYSGGGSGVPGLVRIDPFGKVDWVVTGFSGSGDDIWVDFDGSVLYANFLGAIDRLYPDNTIRRIAGTGVKGYSGDNGPADQAHLNTPQGVTMDDDGNIYISDYVNCNVRKVDRVTRIITTVAGNYNLGCGYNGDGIPAIAAQLNNPMKVICDSLGNLLIVDRLNHCVRKVDANGIITTVAGICGSPGSTGEGIPATQAQLYYPNSVDVDAWGNIYIGDNGYLRKIGPNGLINTIISDFGHCAGISVDLDGNIYLANWDDKNIYRYVFSPIISDIVPSSGPPGTKVVVSGKYFGSIKDSNYVTLRNTNLNVTNWSNTEVHVLIPPGVKSGNIIVNAEGGESNAVYFRVTK